jgi:hypothetical protein
MFDVSGLQTSDEFEFLMPLRTQANREDVIAHSRKARGLLDRTLFWAKIAIFLQLTGSKIRQILLNALVNPSI